MKTPCLRSVNTCSTSDAGGIVVVIKLMRFDQSRPPVGIDEDARITNQLRTSVMTIDREPLIAQLIATDVCKTQHWTSFQ